MIEFFGFYVNETLVDVFILLVHLNSVIDPVLYAFNIPDFRESLKGFFQRRYQRFEN